MKLILLIPSALLLFAGGWWLDGAYSEKEDSSKGLLARIPHLPQAGPKSGAEEAQKKAAAGASGLQPGPPSAATADDLVKMCVAGEETGSHVRLARALMAATPAQLRVLAGDLKPFLKRKQPPDHENVRMVMTAVAERWLSLEPAAALEFALEHRLWDAGETIQKALQKVFATDFEKAVQLMAHKQMDRVLYIDARYDWIRSLKGTPAPRALEMIVDFDARTKNEAMTADALGPFPAQWIRQDPAAAMTWALALPPSHTRREALESMAAAWGRTDAAAARRFLDSLPPATLPSGALKSVMLSALEQSGTSSSAEDE